MGSSRGLARERWRGISSRDGAAHADCLERRRGNTLEQWRGARGLPPFPAQRRGGRARSLRLDLHTPDERRREKRKEKTSRERWRGAYADRLPSPHTLRVAVVARACVLRPPFYAPCPSPARRRSAAPDKPQIVHRDLKSSNILLDATGKARVAPVRLGTDPEVGFRNDAWHRRVMRGASTTERSHLGVVPR